MKRNLFHLLDTIYYLPLKQSGMDLDSNLFNVATSRAKKGTFIITYSHISIISNISAEVQLFLEKN